jgi:hypothetical protein
VLKPVNDDGSPLHFGVPTQPSYSSSFETDLSPAGASRAAGAGLVSVNSPLLFATFLRSA